MIKSIVPFITLMVVTLMAAGTLTACDSRGSAEDNPAPENVAEAPPAAEHAWTQCVEPRPEMCTQIYQPVCGAVDTGVRCVTTPCSSEEYKTFGNACTACGDERVSAHRPGECEAPEGSANNDFNTPDL